MVTPIDPVVAASADALIIRGRGDQTLFHRNLCSNPSIANRVLRSVRPDLLAMLTTGRDVGRIHARSDPLACSAGTDGDEIGAGNPNLSIR